MDFPVVKFTIIYVIIAILFLISAFLKREFMFSYLLSCGCSAVGGILLTVSNAENSEALAIRAAIIPMGLIMIILGANNIIAHRRCNKAVTAKYLGYTTGSHKGIRWYFPEFSYSYLGKKYRSTSFLSCTESSVKEIAKKNEITIYINSKKPEICAFKRTSVSGAASMLIVFGVLSILATIIFPIL